MRAFLIEMVSYGVVAATACYIWYWVKENLG
jgi:hypothetical protein